MKLLLVIGALLCPVLIWSQEITDPVKQNIIEQRIEVIAEQFEDEELDFTTLFDELSFYYDNPLNLNNATEEDLKSLFLLTDRQVLELLTYRKKYGQFVTIYEIPYVHTMDPATVDLVLPFVTVSSGDRQVMPVGKRFKYGRSQMFIRYQRVLEEMQGYSDISDSALAASPNSRYKGSPDKLYMRYRFQYSNLLSIGVTAEKDAGEQFFGETQKTGFDYYSAHLYLKDVGKIRKLLVGDYQVQFGQGLTAWSGLAFGKSAIVRNMKRNAVGVKPYTSVDENIFMRGGAATLGFGKVEFTAFGSYKNIDGNLATVEDTTDNSDEATFTAFQGTGYHRTENEIEDKDAISELHAGSHLAYKTEKANIGVTGLFTSYGTELVKDTRPHQEFDFQGDQNYNVSVDYNAFVGPFNLFGESAISQSGGMAHLHGAMAELDGQVRFIGLVRAYDRDYHGLLANAFGEGSNTQNEIGTVLGVEAKLHKYFDMQGYADFYRWNWLGYLRDGLGNGQDYLAQLNFKPNSRTTMYLRYKWESKPRNDDDIAPGIDFLENETKQQVRLHFDRRVNNIKLRSRFEWIGFDPNDGEREHGYMIYQDVIWTLRKAPVNVAFRYALFETDTYDARIYAYENDVLYAFSIPAYYYRGSRTYITIKYKPTRNIDMWFRWGQFYYNDRNVISSGLNEIQGNTRTEVKAQVRFKF